MYIYIHIELYYIYCAHIWISYCIYMEDKYWYWVVFIYIYRLIVIFLRKQSNSLLPNSGKRTGFKKKYFPRKSSLKNKIQNEMGLKKSNQKKSNLLKMMASPQKPNQTSLFKKIIDSSQKKMPAQDNFYYSRYKEDFEELQLLGNSN